MEPQTPTINTPNLLNALQQALRHNLTSHGLILIDPNLISASIQTIQRYIPAPTLQEYLLDGEALTPIESDFLALLDATPGQAVSYADIRTYTGIKSELSLWVHKLRLASKLRPEFELVAIRNRGYALLRKVQDANLHR